jgi:hypothetical protein
MQLSDIAGTADTSAHTLSTLSSPLDFSLLSDDNNDSLNRSGNHSNRRSHAHFVSNRLVAKFQNACTKYQLHSMLSKIIQSDPSLLALISDSTPIGVDRWPWIVAESRIISRKLNAIEASLPGPLSILQAVVVARDHVSLRQSIKR